MIILSRLSTAPPALWAVHHAILRDTKSMRVSRPPYKTSWRNCGNTLDTLLSK